MSDHIKYLLLSALVAAPISAAASSLSCEKSFSSLDIAITGGTTGIGIDLSTNINDYISLRLGYTRMPDMNVIMPFSIQIGDDDESDYESKEAYNEVQNSRFSKMSGYMEDLTGMEIDRQVDMIGNPSFWNFKLIADIKPFRDKGWYLSAGFYYGSSEIGHAYNTTEDMPALLALTMYNRIYERVYDLEYNDDSQYDGVFMGIEFPPEINEKFLNAGRMGLHVGDFKDGTKYVMVADEDNMVKARMVVNKLKPYLGAGFKQQLGKKGLYSISADFGVLFWGGVPNVYTHDGTDLCYDLDNIWGQVGKYVDIAKKFPVYPVFEISISHTLF